MSELMEKDISHELWREYEHGGQIFKIEKPKMLYYREDGTTHRVIDSEGIAHCHPISGNGCALRWKNPDGEKPVNF